MTGTLLEDLQRCGNPIDVPKQICHGINAGPKIHAARFPNFKFQISNLKSPEPDAPAASGADHTRPPCTTRPMTPSVPISSDLVSRLTPLFDGRPGIRGTLHVEISEPREEMQKSDGSRQNSDAPGAPTDAHSTPDSRQSTPADRPSSLDAGPSTAVLDFVSSDDTLDRYGEIIIASGWRLDKYRRNPVFQNAHQYGDVIFTLGRALITEVRQTVTSFSSSLAAPDPARAGE